MSKPEDRVDHAPAQHAGADVAAMFDSIAPRYDVVNRVLSFRQDRAWRKRLVRSLAADAPCRVLDVAAGTGDVLLALARGLDSLQRGVGLDMATAMLAIVRRAETKMSAVIQTEPTERPLRRDPGGLLPVTGSPIPSKNVRGDPSSSKPDCFPQSGTGGERSYVGKHVHRRRNFGALSAVLST